MIRVMATEDGTYAVYRDSTVLITGLSRAQADAFAVSVGAIREYKLKR